MADRLVCVYAYMRVCVVCKALLENIVLAVDNGGRRLPVTAELGYTREQAEAIQKLKHAKDDYQRLGLHYDASRYDITNLCIIGSRPSDHYFRSVCWFVCLSVCFLFVCAEFFSAVFDPISIKLGHMLYVWV